MVQTIQCVQPYSVKRQIPRLRQYPKYSPFHCSIKVGSRQIHFYFYLFTEEIVNRDSYISEEEYSGALILVPSFSRQKNSSSIWTPGYGEAPRRGSLYYTQLPLCIYIRCFYYCVHLVDIDQYEGRLNNRNTSLHNTIQFNSTTRYRLQHDQKVKSQSKMSL